MRHHPTPYQARTLWNAAAGLALAVLAVLLAAIVWLTGKTLGLLQPVIIPIAVAGVIAYILDPVVRWIERRLSEIFDSKYNQVFHVNPASPNQEIPPPVGVGFKEKMLGWGRGNIRLCAVVSTFLAFLLAGTLLAVVAVPMVGNQINKFRATAEAPADKSGQANDKLSFDERILNSLIQLRNNHPWTQSFVDNLLAPPSGDRDVIAHNEAVARLSAQLDRQHAEKPAGNVVSPAARTILLTDTTLWEYVKSWGSVAWEWVRGSTSQLFNFLGLALGLVMVPIYLFYFLRDSSAIRAHWHDYVPLKASHFKDELVATLMEINGYLIAFFRGQVLLAVIDGALIGICLTLFGLPLGLLFGLIMAVLGVIPFVGNILTLIPACLMAWFHFSDPANQSWLGHSPWAYVAAVCVIFFGVQQINSFVTAPRIIGDSVGLHPMTVIFSMLFWSLLLGGFVGAFLAIPLTAALKVVFKRYVWDKKIHRMEEEISAPSQTGRPSGEPL